MIRFVPLCAAAAIAACSAEPQRNAAAPAPAGTPPVAAAATPAAAAAPSDSAAAPRPGELKTFGDWTVGCDNGLRCELRSLQPDAAEPGDVTVSLARDAGPAGRFSATLDGEDGGDLVPAIDGHAVGGGADRPARLAAAMVDARVLSALSAGKAVATVSLKGASAALRYVDAVQGRAGTVTALVAKGPRPASAVPPARPLPTIVAATPGGTAATPSAAEVAAMRKAAACDDGDRLGDPTAHALGGGRTLVLLPCSSGAYNLSSAVFVSEGAGFAKAHVDVPTGFTENGADPEAGVPTVVNGEFRDGVLFSYAKARGLGDCGTIQELVWDGTRLRLSKQRAMDECRGNTDYITTWRATVVRR